MGSKTLLLLSSHSTKRHKQETWQLPALFCVVRSITRRHVLFRMSLWMSWSRQRGPTPWRHDHQEGSCKVPVPSNHQLSLESPAHLNAGLWTVGASRRTRRDPTRIQEEHGNSTKKISWRDLNPALSGTCTVICTVIVTLKGKLSSVKWHQGPQ